MQPHVYIITDTRDGMRYIGKHIGTNRHYFAGGIIINNIIKKNGGLVKAKQFLKREIIVQGDFNQTLLCELERHYIRLYNTQSPHGHNLTSGGDGAPNLSEESKKRRLLKNKGYKHTPEAKEKMRSSFKGRVISREQREEHSRFMTGRKMPVEGVLKSVATRRKNGDYIWTNDRRIKLSLSRKGAKAPNAIEIFIYKEGVLMAEFNSLRKACSFLGYKCPEVIKYKIKNVNECEVRGYILKRKKPI